MKTRRYYQIVGRSFTAIVFVLAGIGFTAAPASAANETVQLECRENASGKVLGDIRISYRVDAISARKQQWNVGGYTLDIVDGTAPKMVRITISLDTGFGKNSRTVSARPGRPSALSWRLTTPIGPDPLGFTAVANIGKLRYTCRSIA